jgi:hypothetical protein
MRRPLSVAGWLLDWLVPEQNPAGVAYGVILIAALLAAESARSETYSKTLGSALIALLLYWLAHAYVRTLGDRLLRKEPLTAAVLWRALSHDWAIVRGASIPVIALVIAWAAQAQLTSAVNSAVWTSVGSIVVLELAAAVRTHSGLAAILLQSTTGVMMASGILALKLVLH